MDDNCDAEFHRRVAPSLLSPRWEQGDLPKVGMLPHNTQQDAATRTPAGVTVISPSHIRTLLPGRSCVGSKPHSGPWLRLPGSTARGAHKGAFVLCPSPPHICRDVKSRGLAGKPR